MELKNKVDVKVLFKKGLKLMNWLKNIKIGTRLLCSFLLVALISGLVGFIGIKDINKVNNIDTDLYGKNTLAISYITKITDSYLTYRQDLVFLLINKDSVKQQEIVDNLKGLESNITKYSQLLKRTADSNENEDNFQRYTASYIQLTNQFIDLIQSGKYDEANSFLNNNVYKSGDELQKTLEKITDYNIEQAKEKSDNNDVTTASSVRMMIILIIISVLLAIGLGLLGKFDIASTLEKAVDYNNVIASRDLSGSVSKKFLRRKDEIGDLARSTQTLQTSIGEILQKLKEKSNTLAATAEQLNAGAQQISAGATETASTMNEISGTMQNVVEITQDVSKQADEASKSADIGQQNVSIIKEQMKEISEAAYQSSVSADALKNTTKKIGQFVEIITNIADQTNLLALNAAIEAARAGEHGRGFAVVAEEVRKLAEQSANSTKEIKQLIQEIDEQTQQSVQVLTTGRGKVEKGNKIVGEISKGFIQIINSIKELDDKVRGIADATQQVTAGVENVASATEEQTATLEESTAATENLSKLAEEVNDMVNKFKI